MVYTVKADEREALLRRILFLAYRASRVVGMGIFQARDGMTEADVTNHVMMGAQRGGISADYVFGRMVKLYIDLKDDDKFVLPEGRGRSDYQSWVGQYPTYESLVEAASHETGIKFMVEP